MSEFSGRPDIPRCPKCQHSAYSHLNGKCDGWIQGLRCPCTENAQIDFVPKKSRKGGAA